MSEENRRLPIKVVLPRDTDFIRPPAGGGEKKLFCEVTPLLRQEIATKIEKVESFFSEVFRNKPGLPGVARVILRPEALAKSHRPKDLFNRNTCPIIGLEGFGELLISVQKQGLNALSLKVLKDPTKSATFQISTIETIEPYDFTKLLGSEMLLKIKENILNENGKLKLRLFTHNDKELDEKLLYEFRNKLSELELPSPQQLNYAPGIRIFSINHVDSESIEPLSKFIGTQNLGFFPKYEFVRSASTEIRTLEADEFPEPEPGRIYPLVGIIDSGTDPNNSTLQSWVECREIYVPSADQDNDHGSFVAGLVTQSRRLNNNNPLFPDVSSRIVDVIALPGKGGLSEDDLLVILEEVLQKYPKVKVWNLSIGAADAISQVGSISHLGVAMDNLQDKYNMTFVMSAGNYTQAPLRTWPSQIVGDEDRILVPADSVRAVTVGSVAHLDSPNTRVRRGEPSPFSRRGPGPSYMPKPELVHYGGNCNDKGRYTQTGVLSLNRNGRIAENVGTSFSTPIVATLLANISENLLEAENRTLAKALLIHSAVLESGYHMAQELQYRGFGVPAEPQNALTCTPWSATMIFETKLVPGLEFEKTSFPIPPCLRGKDGKVFAEFAVTLVYEPPLDPAFGSEYCRTNVEVSLGTYELNPKTGKREHTKQIPALPKHVNKLYERYLVEHGFKWSPVKVYRRNIIKGVKGEEWRLKVGVQNRSGFNLNSPQPVALIVTISDPRKELKVYDEVVNEMKQNGWATMDLKVQERIRSLITE